MVESERFCGDAGADALLLEQFMCTLRTAGVDTIVSPGISKRRRRRKISAWPRPGSIRLLDKDMFNFASYPPIVAKLAYNHLQVKQSLRSLVELECTIISRGKIS